MRTSERVLWTLIAALVIFLGCGKSSKAPPPGTSVDIIDASQFRPTFASASPEAQATVNKIMMAIQGSDFMRAHTELETPATAPGLPEPKKKAAEDLSEQVKKKLAAAPEP